MDQAIAKAISSEAASRPRALGQSDILPNGNLDVNLSQALVKPGSSKDLVLEDGDIINIPERPTAVSISGAVMLPSAVLFEPGQSIQYYIDRAGGVTVDAATDNVLIIRANGALIRYKKGIRIEVGDNILIPTKVMSIRLVEKANALNQFTSIASSAAITIALIRSLTR
jgi:protein involved in polysaccharide export with SLBB domain